MPDTLSLRYSRKCALQWSVNKSMSGCLVEQECGFKWVHVFYRIPLAQVLINRQFRSILQQNGKELLLITGTEVSIAPKTRGKPNGASSTTAKQE